MDLFRPFGDSITNFVDHKSYSFSFCKLNDAIKLIPETGVGAELAKQVDKHDFCLVLVRPADWHSL